MKNVDAYLVQGYAQDVYWSYSIVIGKCQDW